MKNIITKGTNGTHEVTISFDITDHGHNFSTPRNYSLSQITKLIRSKEVQDAIKNGYAICMYGHGARSAAQGYLANERNDKTGDEQEPIGKITSLSISGKIITYTAKLVETVGNKTQSVARLIENNIGGFSFVWNVPKGIFYGADYVLSPNFNGNRVVMDSICSGGNCMLGDAIDHAVMDAIGNHSDMYEDAKDLIEHQEGVIDAIRFKEKITAMSDSINSLQSKIDEQENIIHNKNVDIEAQMDEINTMSKKIKDTENAFNTYAETKTNEIKTLEELLEDINKDNEESKSEVEKLKAEIERLSASLESNGLMDDNGNIKLTKDALGDLFKGSSTGYQKTVDKVTQDSLRTAQKRTTRDPLEGVTMNYGGR